MNDPRPHAAFSAVFAALALAAAPASWAVAPDELPDVPTFEHRTVLEMARDLDSDEAGPRQFAARELRRQARSAARRAVRGHGESGLEARVTLADLRQDVSGAATHALLARPDVRGDCADLLSALGQSEALDDLQAALELEPRPRVRERLLAAITALEAEG
jgi:hypothetical protein